MLKGKAAFLGEGEGGEVWLAGSGRMSHSAGSPGSERRAYSELRLPCVRVRLRVVRVRRTVCKPSVTRPNPTVTRFLSAATAPLYAPKENESRLATKPQHRSQSYMQIFCFCALKSPHHRSAKRSSFTAADDFSSGGVVLLSGILSVRHVVFMQDVWWEEFHSGSWFLFPDQLVFPLKRELHQQVPPHSSPGTTGTN